MRPSTVLQLKRYLETISGVSPHLQPLEVSRLPLFLRNRYQFYSAELFGRPWRLALEDESWDPGSAGEYEKQAETLRPLLKAPVVFILPALPSNTRNRMVQKGIPFIVPAVRPFSLAPSRISGSDSPNHTGRVARRSVRPLSSRFFTILNGSPSVASR